MSHSFTFCSVLYSINVRPSLEANLLGAHHCIFTLTVDRQTVLRQLPQAQLCDANVKLYLAKQPFSPKLGVRKILNKRVHKWELLALILRLFSFALEADCASSVSLEQQRV